MIRVVLRECKRFFMRVELWPILCMYFVLSGPFLWIAVHEVMLWWLAFLGEQSLPKWMMDVFTAHAWYSGLQLVFAWAIVGGRGMYILAEHVE